MNLEDQQALQQHLQAAAAILYKNTDPAQLKDLLQLEQAVRQQVLEHVTPPVTLFLSKPQPVSPEDGNASSKAV